MKQTKEHIQTSPNNVALDTTQTLDREKQTDESKNNTKTHQNDHHMNKNTIE